MPGDPTAEPRQGETAALRPGFRYNRRVSPLRIASPCTASWDAMRPVDGGRFCDQCRRKVHDLTRMTAPRAHAYALLFGGSGLCGRLNLDASGNPVFRPEPAARGHTRAALPMLATAASLTACARSDAEVAAPNACAPAATITIEPGRAAPRAAPTAAASSSAGPVDSDGDGLADPDDDCPRDPAASSAGGCPEPRRVIVTTAGDVVIFMHPRFAPGRAALDADQRPFLDEVAKVIQATPQIRRVVVEGHTDDQERNASALSLARAQAVIAYLVKRGVAPTRLEAQAAGAARPLDDNTRTEGRARNRRVEFRIVEP